MYNYIKYNEEVELKHMSENLKIPYMPRKYLNFLMFQTIHQLLCDWLNDKINLIYFFLYLVLNIQSHLIISEGVFSYRSVQEHTYSK